MASPGIKQLLAALAGKPLGTPVFGIGQNPIPTFKEGFSPPGQRPNTLYSPGGEANPGVLEQMTPWQGPSFNESLIPTGPRTPTQMGVSPFEKSYDLPDGWRMDRTFAGKVFGIDAPKRKYKMGTGIGADYDLIAPDGTIPVSSSHWLGRDRGALDLEEYHKGAHRVDVWDNTGVDIPFERPSPAPPEIGMAFIKQLARMIQQSGKPLGTEFSNPKLAKLVGKAIMRGDFGATPHTRRDIANIAKESRFQDDN